MSMQQADRFEALLVRIELHLRQHGQLLAALLTEGQIMFNTIDQLRDDLRTNTDAVAARIDTILQQLQQASDNTASPATLADLQVIRDHLKALGTNPTNPVPALPPAPIA